ncbi:MAG TPA: hypothetical protein VGO48_06290 [Conexibacter sp.]|jgi:hypothetical protein|nr:hypothetical protein [Conexibacter sp.]
MHRKVAAALVAALALAVASCGGSESETLTGAALVRRIETACREGQREATKQTRAARGSASQETFLAALLAGQKAELDALDGVTTTGAAKADFEAFKEGVQTRIDLVERVASADRADVQRTLRAVQPEAEVAARKLQAAARSLGVEGCS